MNEFQEQELEQSEEIAIKETVDLDLLGEQLEERLHEELQGLEDLKEEHEKIGSPEALGETVMEVVWEQIVNQIGVTAGEEFIKENKGLNLDLSKDAHYQTTENFAKGKIATHNTIVNYQKRYDDWQGKFEHEANGQIRTHQNRLGREEANIKSDARKPFDGGRPSGNKANRTDMDHTVSAGEIIRDPGMNAHLSLEQQTNFANSEDNLLEMDSSLNRSKSDLKLEEWLNNPNPNGQLPEDIFEQLTPELKQKFREKDRHAREKLEQLMKEAEQRSKDAGRQSRVGETKRIGKQTLKAVVMTLLASLVKDILRHLVSWFRSGQRSLESFFKKMGEAIQTFVHNLKQHLTNAADVGLTTIATAIFGPIVRVIKNTLVFLKQGWLSVKQAIAFFRDPKNKSLPLSRKLLEVSKIVVAGLTAGGAIVMGGVIEKGFASIPFFAIEIPLLGSLGSIIGIFVGALISGIIGALLLRFIDNLIQKQLRQENEKSQIERANVVLRTQFQLQEVTVAKVEQIKTETAGSIMQRHNEAADYARQVYNDIDKIAQRRTEQDQKDKQIQKESEEMLDDILRDLDNL
jgi:Domain of unknown function (DUF1994).